MEETAVENPLGEGGLREYIQVQLPRDATAGSTLNVRIPSGEVVTVVVPDGAEPGTYIRTPLATTTIAEPSPSALRESLVAQDVGSAGPDEADEPSWVDAALKAESELRWATWRIRGGLLIGMLATLIAFAADDEFVHWAELPLSASCAAEDDGDPSVAWTSHPQSTKVDLSMFQTSAMEARNLQCTCGSLELESCEARDTVGNYDGNAVGARVGTAHASPTMFISDTYTGGFVNPVVILGLPPRRDEFTSGGNEPRAHISTINPQTGQISFAIRPRCGEAIDHVADDSSTVRISWMVVEAGEREDIAAGKRWSGLDPVQFRFRTSRPSPLVLTQLQTHAHDSSWASASVENVTESGFYSRIIPEPLGRTQPPREHPAEVIGWVAFQPAGRGSLDGLAFEALGVPLENEVPFAFRPLPASDQAVQLVNFGDVQDESWSTKNSIAQQDHLQYRYTTESQLSVNLERSDCDRTESSHAQQGRINTVALLSIQEGLAGAQPKDGEATNPPCRMVQPCHYSEDGFCDEPQGTGLCSVGTDEADCGVASTLECRPARLEVGAATPIRWGTQRRQPYSSKYDDNYERDTHECCAFAWSKVHEWNASWYLETQSQLPLDACCAAEKWDGYTWLLVSTLMIPISLFTLGWTAIDCCLACGCNRNYEYSDSYVRPVYFRVLDRITWVSWMSWIVILKPEIALWRHLTVFCTLLNLCWVVGAAYQKHHEVTDAYLDALDTIQSPSQPGPSAGSDPARTGEPSALRCGDCGVVFGIPAGTTAEQAARCPHCGAINRQPPTFSTKFSQFQARMTEQRRHLQRERKSRNSSKLEVLVTRDALLQSSMASLAELPGQLIRMRPLVVKFVGEEGLDQGGVTREWVDLLFSEDGLMDANWGMFRSADTNDYTYIINPSSSANSDHLTIFSFVGKVLAKCLCDGVTVPVHFTPDLYCHLIGVPLAIKDLQLIDTEVFTSISWMLENNVDDLGFTFEAEVEGKYGSGVVVKELKPNGSNIPVTNENKHEFVELKARFIMCEQRQHQLDALRDGFKSVLPVDEIAMFDVSELELMLCGVPSLDIEDWQAHTDYKSGAKKQKRVAGVVQNAPTRSTYMTLGYSTEHHTIQFFWTIIGAWNNDYRAKLLRFVTGTAAVPPGGFAHLQGAEGGANFSVMKVVWDDPERLPQASTCFNQLLLPEYSDVGTMREKLELAITETVGFGLK